MFSVMPNKTNPRAQFFPISGHSTVGMLLHIFRYLVRPVIKYIQADALLVSLRNMSNVKAVVNGDSSSL